MKSRVIKFVTSIHITCKFINFRSSQLYAVMSYARDYSTAYFFIIFINKYHIRDFFIFRSIWRSINSESRTSDYKYEHYDIVLHVRWSLRWSMFSEMTILWRAQLMINNERYMFNSSLFSKWNWDFLLMNCLIRWCYYLSLNYIRHIIE